MAHILVVDDDPQVLSSISRILEKEGYEISLASNGQQALEIVSRQRPDLVILDIIMPEMDGLQVCRRLRADPYLVGLPIMFLTAKGRADDIIEGLDAGADDFLTKPFEIRVLPARIRAVLRRAMHLSGEATQSVTVGDVSLNTHSLEVQIGGNTVQLTPVEHQLLYYLMSHVGQPIAPEQLLQELWGYPVGTGDPGLVRAHIVKLRGKLNLPPDAPQYIRNIHGKGYLINE